MLRALFILLFVAHAAFAQTTVISKNLEGAKLRGSATYRYLGLALYEATLFTPGGAALDWNAGIALNLRYLRKISQKDLVKATLGEFKRTGGALPLEAELQKCFRSVKAGDQFTAISTRSNSVRFWLNGQQTCTLNYPQIKRRFFGIWLGDNTRSRRFTQQLRGA